MVDEDTTEKTFSQEMMLLQGAFKLLAHTFVCMFAFTIKHTRDIGRLAVDVLMTFLQWCIHL